MLSRPRPFCAQTVLGNGLVVRWYFSCANLAGAVYEYNKSFHLLAQNNPQSSDQIRSSSSAYHPTSLPWWPPGNNFQCLFGVRVILVIAIVNILWDGPPFIPQHRINFEPIIDPLNRIHYFHREWFVGHPQGISIAQFKFATLTAQTISTTFQEQSN